MMTYSTELYDLTDLDIDTRPRGCEKAKNSVSINTKSSQRTSQNIDIQLSVDGSHTHFCSSNQLL